MQGRRPKSGCEAQAPCRDHDTDGWPEAPEFVQRETRCHKHRQTLDQADAQRRQTNPKRLARKQVQRFAACAPAQTVPQRRARQRRGVVRRCSCPSAWATPTTDCQEVRVPKSTHSAGPTDLLTVRGSLRAGRRAGAPAHRRTHPWGPSRGDEGHRPPAPAPRSAPGEGHLVPRTEPQRFDMPGVWSLVIAGDVSTEQAGPSPGGRPQGRSRRWVFFQTTAETLMRVY
ncbi:hypothetical protein H4W33_005920 [Kibdelosporangium phytohabitans]|nr:hypothetical protein [Kibdelosporangium phytohabitans]